MTLKTMGLPSIAACARFILRSPRYTSRWGELLVVKAGHGLCPRQEANVT
ncbi:MAG: DUF4113 domain-containing protein [Lyngbya sp. HA4199-MV5]|nr:DUF4113 domain-containing protein [Lyngbya sp. HA4199-MV5]